MKTDDQAIKQKETEQKVRLKKPNMYRVVMLNDDYTPREFVVSVLQIVFSKNQSESARLMSHIHTRGRGVCGVYTHDIARTKIQQVRHLAEQYEYPLECVLEVEE